MKQIILPLTVLEFIDGIMEENGLAPFFKKGSQDTPNTEGLKKFEIFPAPSYKMQKKNLAPHKKIYLWVGGSIYHGK